MPRDTSLGVKSSIAHFFWWTTYGTQPEFRQLRQLQPDRDRPSLADRAADCMWLLSWLDHDRYSRFHANQAQILLLAQVDWRDGVRARRRARALARHAYGASHAAAHSRMAKRCRPPHALSAVRADAGDSGVRLSLQLGGRHSGRVPRADTVADDHRTGYRVESHAEDGSYLPELHAACACCHARAGGVEASFRRS